MEAVIDRQAADELAEHFAAISKLVPLRPIRSEDGYDAAVASLNALLDAGAADEAHPLADLVDMLGELIGDYDDAHYPSKDVGPGEMLRFLMGEHGLKQSDLSKELGSQGVVSEILNGKRELNIRQIRALAGRFSVPMSAFVERMAILA